MNILSDLKARRHARYVKTIKSLECDGYYERYLASAGVIVKGRQVIEVGPGVGPWMRAFRKCGAARIAGVDISPLYVDALRREGFEAYVGDATSLPLQSGEFDLAFCHLVLPYVKEELAAVDELLRVVRPGGQVFIGLHGSGFYLRQLCRGHLPSAGCLVLGLIQSIFGYKLGTTFQSPEHFTAHLVASGARIVDICAPRFLAQPKVFTILVEKM